LYGLAGGTGAERSLFRYFHGRSSLKTWLRAVLAQRHIDSIRAGRRFEELSEDETGDGRLKTLLGPQMQPGDPHRERYVASFTRALQTALERLEPQEKERLRLYYAEEKTLARSDACSGSMNPASRVIWTMCGAICGVPWKIFFATVSGRRTVFAVQPGLSDAEIALCFGIQRGGQPIDLEKLLPRSKSPGPAPGKRTP